MHGSNCQRVGSGLLVTLVVFSELWLCSPRSKTKTRPRHAVEAHHLAMLLQRRKHVKQVPSRVVVQ
jgi:hypothetical protein